MPQPSTTISKKALKGHINKNGGFLPMSLKVQKNFPTKAEELIRKKYSEKEANEILTKATYFKGVSSNGDLNRNGYIIREKAWSPAINGYMENPLILLQHDPDSVIGETINAEHTKKGLETEGYIFKDQMDEKTALAFERGQLKSLSTGHITQEVEWENEETGEVKSNEEFMELEVEERLKDEWLMAVTALEWVEQSLVSIPSNRKSMITKKNQKVTWFKNNFGEDISEEKLAAIEKNDKEPTKKELEEIEKDESDPVKESEEIINDASKEGGESSDAEDENSDAPDTSENDAEGEETPDEDAENADESEQPDGEAEKEDNSIIERLQTSAAKFTAAFSDLMKNDEEEESSDEEDVQDEEPKDEEENKVKLDVRLDSFDVLCKDLDKCGLSNVRQMLNDFYKTTKNLAEENQLLKDEFVRVLKTTPKRKGLSLVAQYSDSCEDKKEESNKPKKSAFQSILQENGLGRLFQK